MGSEFYMTHSFNSFYENRDNVRHGYNGIDVIISNTQLLIDEFITLQCKAFTSNWETLLDYEKMPEDRQQTLVRKLYFQKIKKELKKAGYDGYFPANIVENDSVGIRRSYKLPIKVWPYSKLPLEIVAKRDLGLDNYEEGFFVKPKGDFLALNGEVLLKYSKDKTPIIYGFYPHVRTSQTDNKSLLSLIGQYA